MRIKKEKEYNYLLAYLSLQVTVSSLSVRLGFYLLLCFWTLVMCQALRNHSTDTYGINEFRTPGQDGRVGPCRTKRRTTTNLKAKNNQNCQKIELYGSLTTKELKEKHSSRPVGGAEMGSQVERTHSKVASGRAGHPTFTGR